MTSPYDDPHGELLARVLKAEGDTLVPAGDGLSRIRDRVEKRRSRLRWLMPAASLATAGALAGAAFGAYTAISTDDGNKPNLANPRPSLVSPTVPAHRTTPPSPVPSTAPSSQRSVTPVWPFSSVDEVKDWQQAYAESGTDEWHLSARSTAYSFVKLGIGVTSAPFDVAGARVKNGNTADVDLSSSFGNNVFATVHLVRWGEGKSAPWEVVGVTTAGARIDSPAPNAGVSSPLVVRYTLDGGNEDDVYTSVWDGQQRLASGQVSVGGGSHEAGLTFDTPSTSTGYVVVADIQSGSGEEVLTRLMVTPVRFVPSTATTLPGKQYPPFFVAVRDQRLGVFYSRLGGLGRWLTEQQPGGGVSSPQLSPDGKWVYFLRGVGTDSQDLVRVPIAGGAEEPMVSNAGHVGAYAIGGDHAQHVAYVVDLEDGGQELHWVDTDNGDGGSFQLDGTPPLIEALAWAPDGRHLAAQVRGGTEWGLRVFDTADLTGVDSGTSVAETDAQAPSYDAEGNLYYLRTVDATRWELVQWDGTTVRHVSTIDIGEQESPEFATVDITPDAYAALVTTASGHVYRVVDGTATLVTPDAAGATW